MSAYTRQDFIGFWPGGFQSCVDQWVSHEATVDACIVPFAHPAHTCLEIGPGGGSWTSHLLPRFAETTAVDVVPRSARLIERCSSVPGYQGLRYIELDDANADELPGVADGSIDFVFSNNVFCHFPQSMIRRYFASIARVLRAGGCGVVMCGNWNIHPLLKDVPEREQYAETVHPMGWYFQNEEFLRSAIEGAGLVVLGNPLPQARDCFLHFRKP